MINGYRFIASVAAVSVVLGGVPAPAAEESARVAEKSWGEAKQGRLGFAVAEGFVPDEDALAPVPPEGVFSADVPPPVPPCPEPACTEPRRAPPPRDGRHLGPLVQQSWLQRPFSLGGFLGIAQGSPLIDDTVGAKQGLFGGLRLGWDSSTYWGIESRLAFTELDLYDDYRLMTWLPFGPDDRQLNLVQWDVHLICYPWGDTKWRPYFSFGSGIAKLTFEDRYGKGFSRSTFDLPLAIGFKYYWTDCLALRLECSDDIVWGGGSVNTLNVVAISGAIEYRFGGPRKTYWPWNPGRRYW